MSHMAFILQGVWKTRNELGYSLKLDVKVKTACIKLGDQENMNKQSRFTIVWDEFLSCFSTHCFGLNLIESLELSIHVWFLLKLVEIKSDC